MRNTKLDVLSKNVPVYVERITTKQLLAALAKPELSQYRKLPETMVPHELFNKFARIANANGHSVPGLVLSLMESYCLDGELLLRAVDKEDRIGVGLNPAA